MNIYTDIIYKFDYHGEGSEEMKKRKVRSIRGEQKFRIIHNPWGYSGRVSEQEEVIHFLSDSGGLETHSVQRQIAFDCGCLNSPLGGFCVYCVTQGGGGMICLSCFDHCRCGRPICDGHAVFVCFEDGKEFRLCRPCFDAATRKSLFENIIYFIRSLL